MKKILVGFIFLLIVFSGCEIMNDKSSEATSKGMNQSVETLEMQSGSSTSLETSKEKVIVEGVWMAMGKEDRVKSTWYFNRGQLVVNYVNDFFYVVEKNMDSNGYTVVTIKNNNEKKHALLLKGNGPNLEGITVEDEEYDQYLADGTVPDGQLIEFNLLQNGWGSMEEAIEFWENTYKNSDNEISKNITWENYHPDLWSIVKDGTSGNTITLHFTNISGAGGSYVQLVKNEETTVITDFGGNAAYPNDPSNRYTVQNDDYKVIKAEELWKKE
ncbi:hypothetical protein LC087_15920 [Bacillus carboniphilus]|uniref:Lipoprotein n=1 Tax=Bacillus carboniphilus TaxID=86663 RepID=A0ABY9JTR1_9BACI|nr:hypothetical protein [Bacillus carboniphilus]WLR42209.1 hypothetical protein LC087_15920 [Bacillus carboniphilus]